MLYAVGDSITFGFYGAGYPTFPNPLVDGYAATVAATLGLPIANTAFPGATMLGVGGSASILQQMLALTPPYRDDLVVTMLGTNDLLVSGTDAAALAAFSAGLRQGLVWLTSGRGRRFPLTPYERWLARAGQLPGVVDGCRVFVGNTPRQSVYTPPGSAAAQEAYSAQVAADVAWAQGQGRRVWLVDAEAAYDPATQGADPPTSVHPGPSGHASIAAAYLAAIRAHL
jgi:lysophospholipase L1-like esterase